MLNDFVVHVSVILVIIKYLKSNLNFIEAGSLLETNETTSVDLTKIYLEKIKEAEKLNCFNTV